MGRWRRNIIGKGEVTRTQVAFIVDRYLCDNGFFKTRALFRSEASSLVSKSSLRHVPSGLMTLDDMLNGYVALKQQKLTLEQEKVRLDQEKLSVQNLLHGMQNVMNTYNASFIPHPLPPAPAPAPAPTPTYQQKNYSFPSSGFTQYNTPNVMSASKPRNKREDSENVSTPLTCSQTEHGKRKVPEVSVRVDSGNVSTPSTSQSVPGKRKVPEVSIEAPPVTRKPRIATAQENTIVNDLVSTSPSVSEPEIDDLFNMDFPHVDETFPISEIFNFDVDSPMKTRSWAPPESWNGNPEPTVTETTQGKDMSTQSVCFDASFAKSTAENSVTKSKSCM